MLRKGHKKIWGGFNTGTWGFSHAEGQGYQKYPPLNKKKKRGGGGLQKVLPCLEGVGCGKRFQTCDQRRFP